MNPIIEKLKTQLLQQPVNYGYNDADSLLKMLYCCYTVDNPIDSTDIHSKFDAVNEKLRGFSVKENSIFSDLVCELCGEYERRAFIEGIHVGVRLAAELGLEA